VKHARPGTAFLSLIGEFFIAISAVVYILLSFDAYRTVMTKPVLLLICFLCCYPFAARAQHGQYRFKHINVDQGLTHNEVISFHKDHKGFLWIGTTAGLNRFDGYAVRTFLNDVRDSLSLSDNYINSICPLPDGRLGFFTPSGLNLYDPSTETFTHQLQDFYKQYNLPDGPLNEIVMDHEQHYWFIHSAAGLIHFDPTTKETFYQHHQDDDTTSIATDSISGFSQNDKLDTWIIHRNGIFEKISPVNGKVIYRNNFLQRKYKNVSQEYNLIADSSGDLWIFQSTGTTGVYFFDVSENQFTHLHQDGKGPRLNTNIVRGITEDNQGLIWIATDHGGINVIDKKNFTVHYILHHEEDEKSIGQNSVNVLYKDDDGIIWAGTFKKGVSYYHENMIRFPLYKSYPSDARSLPFSDVNRFVEDDRGNLWIGTNGGGLIYYDRKKEIFQQFKHDPADPHSISNNVIVSLFIDQQKILWIGTYYGGLNSFDGKRFKRYLHDPHNPESLSDNSVWEIFEDSRARLWIGTLSGGLNLLDRKTEVFTHYKEGDVNSIHDNYISSIMEDKEGNLWIGTARGIDVLMRLTGRFIHYTSEKGNDFSLSNNGVVEMREDSHGRIWIGTRSGLNLFDKEKKQFKALTMENGLPSNTVLTVLEDNDGNLWMSTPNGISHLTIARDSTGAIQYRFKNYDEADGLQGKQFNENAAYKTSRGELIFGGSNGFNLFRPAQLGMNHRPPTVVLSDFQLFQRTIKPGELVDNKVILSASITESTAITLPFNKNFFTVEIAALNYFHPEKNQYRYMLEGLNTTWLPADSKSRRITFTNLDPGDYVFKVLAANNDGVWNTKPSELKITILPPFWKTRTAFVLYVMLVLGALYLTRKLIQQREQMKFAIQQERQEAIRMHELDMMKIKFFTNVSHEFRTPLTLILTPIEKILRQTADGDQQNQFRLIQRNAKRLLNLVNQLLDFRKMEVQEIRFNPSEGDIILFIKETALSFSDLSEKKNIAFNFNSAIPSLETLFDQDKLEKILFNLLSNAFKFTPEHGSVSVNVYLEENGLEKWLTVQVKDSGIGIPADKLDKIFDRFFQNELPKSIVNQGSGIGLSITKEFVRIHNGTINVESEPGQGSTFTLRLPITDVFEHATPPARELSPPLPDYELVAEHDYEGTKNGQPVLLLVEDNEDFRFYLKDNLKFEFRIMEGRNGLEGWQQTIQHIPDLIVSDVMMPEMNGIELCRKIKNDQRVSHIPIILLTARTAEEQKIEGLQVGADDYITKPFSFEILISRIRNLIAMREKFQKAFPTQHEVKASELNITSLDTLFIQNAIRCVEENVGNANFSVEELSKLLGISRANFYKKVLSLTGKSPLEFIRTIRLQHAAQLLEKSQLTVSEVAYSVGFNNPKYFARYFKEAYHELPSSYAMRKRKPSVG
jgi:signal transduction histidine kinase/ligand-binding sensor domain-containing protein/DNA-binding response OmpR family regulator